MTPSQDTHPRGHPIRQWIIAGLLLIGVSAFPLWMNTAMAQSTKSASTTVRDLKLFNTAYTMISQENVDFNQYITEPSDSDRNRFIASATAAANAVSDVENAASDIRLDDAQRLGTEQTTYYSHAILAVDVSATPTSFLEESQAATRAFAILVQDSNGIVLSLSSTADEQATAVVDAQLALFVSTIISILVGVALASLGALVGLAGMRRWKGALSAAQAAPAHDPQADPLTELPTETAFEEYLRSALVEARQSAGRGVTVCSIHLNDLDEIIRLHGQDGADQLVVAASRRLRRIVRDIDTVARGDSNGFLVLLRDLVGRQDVLAITNRIVQVLSRDFRIHTGTVSVKISIGVAIGSPDSDPLDLSAQAGAAVRRARTVGGGVAFSDSVSSRRTGRHASTSDSRGGQGTYQESPSVDHRPDALRALLDTGNLAGQLVLEYKPIVRLADGVTTLVESIATWRHPILGVVSHDDLLLLAEDSGLAIPLSQQLIVEVANQSAAWSSAGTPLVTIIKISAECLGDSDFVVSIQNAIEQSGCLPNLLGIALAEADVGANADQAQMAFDELRQLGVRRIIMNYGVMPVSLPRLQRLGLTEVVLHDKLADGLATSPERQAIILNIIDMSHTVGFAAIASGVRNARSLAFLHHSRCEYAKGPAICGPVPAHQVMLARDKAQRETLSAITHADTGT